MQLDAIAVMKREAEDKMLFEQEQFKKEMEMK